MAVVTKSTYESLSDKIGEAFSAQKASVPYITSGLNEVLYLEDADQEYDLLASWYNANEGTSIFNAPDRFVPLASSLNNHVQLRSGKALTTWMTDESVLVSSDFAVVSKASGFNVDAFIRP